MSFENMNNQTLLHTILEFGLIFLQCKYIKMLLLTASILPLKI